MHRDLKPENLFLVESEQPFVKILDFGISKFDAATTRDFALTREGTPLGTPFYMPPEQVRGERTLGPPADVYALGVVLYECLTGSKPFDAETPPQLAVLIHEGKYTPLRELRPDVPSAVEAAVARAMALNPADRVPSARAFREALDRAEPLTSRTDAPVSSAPSPPSSSADGPSSGAAVGPVSTGPTPMTVRPDEARSRALWVVALIVAAIVGGLIFSMRVRTLPTSAERSASSGASAVSERTLAVSAVPALSVAASVAPGPTVEEPNPPASVPVRMATRTEPRAPAASASGTKELHPPHTRASEHGLIQENPF